MGTTIYSMRPLSPHHVMCLCTSHLLEEILIFKKRLDPRYICLEHCLFEDEYYVPLK